LKNGLWINSPEDINGNGTFEAWPFDQEINGVTGDFNGKDDDGNGYIDDVIGFDFVDQAVANFGDYRNPDPVPEDEGEHGTLVTGLISAEWNNSVGIAGMAPGAKILTAKAFDVTGNGETDDIAAAIVYSVMQGAKVLNFSFGDNVESPIMKDAIRFAYSMGCVMVSSSGNSNWDYRHYPSDYPEVISVGGSNPDGGRFSRANYGNYIDVIAPGMDIITTDLNNEYKVSNGTSLAAPYVSGLAAMLHQKYPGIDPDAVKGILKATANDINEPGWDYRTGSGIINAERALKYVGQPAVEIFSPAPADFVNSVKTDTLEIHGTAAHPLFVRYEILYGAGNNPDTLTSLLESGEQVKKGLLGSIPVSDLEPGRNVIVLRCHSKEGNFIDSRAGVNVISNEDIEFNELIVNNAYRGNSRVVVVSAKSSGIGKFFVRFRPAGSNEKYTGVSEFDWSSEFRYLEIGKEAESGIEMEATAFLALSSGDTLKHDFTFTRLTDEFTSSGLVQKPYSLGRLYLFNGVAEFTGNGKTQFAATDLSTLTFGETFFFEYDDGNIFLSDTNKFGWIPTGYPDTDGDGRPEFFGTADYNSILLNSNSETAFGDTLFTNPEGTTFWGDLAHDLDGDGREELIGWKDDVSGRHYFAWSYKNGEYIILDSAVLPDDYDNISISKSAAAGDFDGDGNQELAFANTSGMLFIYEFANGKFTFEKIFDERLTESQQYLTTADVDADGFPEIIQGSIANSGLYGEVSFDGESIWHFRMIKASGQNAYEIKWEEFFTETREGFTKQQAAFRNGLAAGDLDGSPGDEFVISTFPNLYVFKWEDEKIKPFWYYPSVLSNSAIIADFDKNGINELGFSGFNRTMFFEYDAELYKIQPPAGLDGHAPDTNTAYVNWTAAENADKYQIFRLQRDNEGVFAILLGETENSEVNVSSLAGNQSYEFVLKSINSSDADTSGFSDIIEVFTTPRILPEAIISKNNSSITVKYTGKLPQNSMNPDYFTISSDGFRTIPAGATTTGDSVLVLAFEELPEGDYNFVSGEFRDYYGNFAISDTIAFSLGTADDNEIYLKKLEIVKHPLVKLYFSENVIPETAELVENYELRPYGEILNAQISPLDSSSVLLNLTNSLINGPARGVNFTITVRNIETPGGKKMTEGPGNTLGFLFANDNLTDTYVYPNPIKRSENPDIYFAGLTPRATVTIMTLDGQELRRLEEKDGNGGVEWDGRDINGDYLPTGIYMYKVEGTDSDGNDVFENYHKFAIVP
jgi:hypothetical protein